jgi:uncharacterized membrane protein
LKHALAYSLIVSLAGSTLADPGFTGIGDLPGGPLTSEAFGISESGTDIVGYGTIAGNFGRAIHWSAGVMTQIDDPNGVYTTRAAYAITNRGVLVGEAQGPSGVEGFKYNLSGANRYRTLGGNLPGGFFGGAAYDVSAGGSLVVGSREQSGFRLEACRWDGPSISGLGYLAPGGFQSLALGVSLDGTTIVGGSDAASDYLAFKIGSDGVMTQLATLPGLVTSEAKAVNQDGNVIVGTATLPGRTAALIWTNGVVSELADLSGGFNFASANACDSTGDVVVGRSSSDAGLEAVVWRNGRVHIIRELLTAAGVTSHVGWFLSNANGVSSNGLVVCGSGINPNGETEGWVATLPETDPVPCAADFNGDGFLDFFDYDDYVNCFETGICPPGKTADFNGDNFVDFFDYDDFVTAFELGC